MINVLLDPLPTECECESGNVYRLDTDFRIGIQVALCQDDSDLSEYEKSVVVADLILADGEQLRDIKDLEELVTFFMSGWYTDNRIDDGDKRRYMDYDVDQWRIYAAFRQQYGMDLNTVEYLHYWAFMGMLLSLEECSYTRVIEIRKRKIDPKMDASSKKDLLEAKEVFRLSQTRTQEQKEEDDLVDSILGSVGGSSNLPEDEKRRIAEFEKYAEESIEIKE